MVYVPSVARYDDTHTRRSSPAGAERHFRDKRNELTTDGGRRRLIGRLINCVYALSPEETSSSEFSSWSELRL